jgi:hypothetical protein
MAVLNVLMDAGTKEIKMRITDSHIYFWGDIFSNFYDADFVIDDVIDDKNRITNTDEMGFPLGIEPPF